MFDDPGNVDVIYLDITFLSEQEATSMFYVVYLYKGSWRLAQIAAVTRRSELQVFLQVFLHLHD